MPAHSCHSKKRSSQRLPAARRDLAEQGAWDTLLIMLSIFFLVVLFFFDELTSGTLLVLVRPALPELLNFSDTNPSC